MGKETKALILQLRPKYEELTGVKRRGERTYTEEGVKRLLFVFAREIGCDWTDEELKKTIEDGFDFD